MAIKTVHAELIFHAQNTLGEGPWWHPVENAFIGLISLPAIYPI